MMRRPPTGTWLIKLIGKNNKFVGLLVRMEVDDGGGGGGGGGGG